MLVDNDVRSALLKAAHAAFVTTVVSALGVGLSPACGSTSISATPPRDDASTTTCSPGDTRICVGPGACQGGERCSDDGTWGICDCRSVGTAGHGGSGSGGTGSTTGGALGTTSDGSAGDGGATGGRRSEESGVDSRATGGEPEGGWVDDPCPTNTEFVAHCDGPDFRCGVFSASECSQIFESCEDTSATNVTIPTTSPWDVRTPPTFEARCACAHIAHSLRLRFAVPSGIALSGRFSIAPPWRIRTGDLNDRDFCSDAGQSCVSVSDVSKVSFFLFTAETNPPIRNLIWDDGSCP